ncbi:MAG: DUF1592 domain-containing protein [Pirellulaceae bacterium]
MIPLFHSIKLSFVVAGLLVCALPVAWWSGPNPVAPFNMAQATHHGTDDFDQIARPFLQTYCLKCHSGEDAEAGLDLSSFDSQVAVNADLETWELIIEAIDDEYMPPSDEQQPDEATVDQLKSWYQKTIDGSGQAEATIPWMRRLNRVEYENTVRDLLRIDGDIFTNADKVLLVDDYFRPETGRMPRYVLALSHFSYIQKRPPLLDGVGDVPVDPPLEHGFSNDYTTLSISPLQAERYFELAVSILNSPNLAVISELWGSMFLPGTDTTYDQLVSRARQRLNAFLPRAFRRPIIDGELDRFANLFAAELRTSGSYTEAMKSTVAAVMTSPSFLFRRDFSEDSYDEYRVDQFAIASRLSYFLWATMPDDELFQAAREGRLGTREGLLQQTRRMMKDKRIKSLATDFGMQWLQVASVTSARPDKDMYPYYYASRQVTPGVSMMIEQLLFFETMMIEDRDIMEFVHADWSYLNRNLMDWYQVNPQEVAGYTPERANYEDFFRVRWPNKHRGGVITSGATLVSTSATDRTSPVYRGIWVMDVIFNRPPPPPPAAVPTLEEAGQDSPTPLNLREKLAVHREDATCAVCHDRIDPIGFALEKFDPVGRFRTAYEDGAQIDCEGELYDENYDGAAQFKAVIMRNERQFVGGFVEHRLKYALGRQLELADEEYVRTIVQSVGDRDRRFSAVVEGIVTSDLFCSPASQ